MCIRDRAWEDEEPLINGLVVGFDKDKDPIVYFPARSSSDAYYTHDIEVLSEFT